MAKARWAQGLRTGSTKTTTYSTLSTEKEGRVQIIKDRVEKVTNPKTRNQMIVRACLGTVSQAASKMAKLIEISREGVTNRRFARQQFISENCNFLQSVAQTRGGLNMHPYAVFAPKNNQQLIPNSYIVSKGSLSMKDGLIPKPDNEAGSFGNPGWANVGVVGSLPFGSYTADTLWRTIFGIGAGDQLSLPQILSKMETAQALYDGAGNVVDKTVVTLFACPRLVLLQNMPATEITIGSSTTAAQIRAALLSGVDTTQTYASLLSTIFEAIDIDEIVDEVVQVAFTGKYDTVFGLDVPDGKVLALGTILSRKDESNNWKYSTCQLACVWDWLGQNSGQDYFGFLLDNAIGTYAGGSSLTADGNFLQSGGDADIIPEGFM